MADLKSVTLAIDPDPRTKPLVFAEYFAFEKASDITPDYSMAKYHFVIVGKNANRKTLNPGDKPVVHDPMVKNQVIRAIILTLTAEGGSPHVPPECPYKDGSNGNISYIALTYSGLDINGKPVVGEPDDIG